MITKQPIPGTDRVRVTFELPSCIWADRIFVVGEFNGWNRSETRMRQGRDAIWRATLELEAGRQYQFRYLIDGQWQNDWHADGSSHNGYDGENSIVDTSNVPMRVVEGSHGSLLHEERAAPGGQHRMTLPQRKSLRVAA
jgi:1,4-alpha-glucan branching enzyme